MAKVWTRAVVEGWLEEMIQKQLHDHKTTPNGCYALVNFHSRGRGVLYFENGCITYEVVATGSTAQSVWDEIIGQAALPIVEPCAEYDHMGAEGHARDYAS